MPPPINHLIAQGNTEAAIRALIQATAPDAMLHREANLLSGRFEAYRQALHTNQRPPAELSAERNQIHAAILDIAARLPPGAAARRWSAKPLALWLGIAAAIAGITGYTLRDVIFPPRVPASPTEDSRDTATTSPPSPQPAPATAVSPQPVGGSAATKNQTHIQVQDQGKVGTVVTGDSNVININQDF